MVYLTEADKAARKLQKVLDIDSQKHGGRNTHDIIDSAPIEYFDLDALVEGYTTLREHQKKVRRILKAIRDAGNDIDFYDLDEI